MSRTPLVFYNTEPESDTTGGVVTSLPGQTVYNSVC